MKGVLWNGKEFNWQHKPSHYSAIHFHDDDIYDAQWQKTLNGFTRECKKWLYCAHFLIKIKRRLHTFYCITE